MSITNLIIPDPSIAIAIAGGCELLLAALRESNFEKKNLFLIFSYVHFSIGVLLSIIITLGLDSQNLNFIIEFLSLVLFLLCIFIISFLANKYLTINKWNYLESCKTIKFLIRSLSIFCYLSALILIY